MRTLTYLLVDFENLQPPAEHVTQIRGQCYRLWVFHGPHQNKFAADMVVAWQPLGDQVRFIQSTKTGKNALDFHIAFCLGQVQQQNANTAHETKYVVVSKDGGFDPLFDYMRSLGCAVGKADSIPDALALAAQLKPASVGVPAQPFADPKPAAKKATKKSVKQPAGQPSPDRDSKNAVVPVDKIITYLRAHPNNRPATLKALENHVPSMLGGTVKNRDVSELIAKLEVAGLVKISGETIEYKIPKSKSRK